MVGVACGNPSHVVDIPCNQTVFIVILILLTAYVTNQCSQFFFMLPPYVFNKLCANKCQVVLLSNYVVQTVCVCTVDLCLCLLAK